MQRARTTRIETEDSRGGFVGNAVQVAITHDNRRVDGGSEVAVGGNDLVMGVLSALASAKNASDYRKAKLLMTKLGRVEQLAMVDSVRSTRARLTTKGVRL